MTDSNKRLGQKIKLTLIGNLHYSGKIIFEDDLLITIIDRFEKEVSFGKSNIVSMEVIS